MQSSCIVNPSYCSVSIAVILIDCAVQIRGQFPIDAIDSMDGHVDGVWDVGIGIELTVPQEPPWTRGK